MKNRKILVFGSSGFLGNHLVKSLYKDNKVIQFDTKPPQRKYEGTSFIRGSILDKALVINAMEDIDVVYHFAALTDLDTVNNDPAPAIEINIAGTSNILDACVEKNIERLIFSSSVYVYSKSGGVYKSTKQACELLIKDYDKMYDLNYTILQLGSVYGPNSSKKNLITRFIIEALEKGEIKHFGTGDEIRKYIFVDDVIKAAIGSIKKKYNKQKLIVIGNEPVSIYELMNQIITLLGSDINKIFDNKNYNIHYKSSPFDTDLDGAINFKNNLATNLKEGLRQTISSIQN
tara:strand:- start:1650 stop:2516 length:867 start_codon:yes stop_codon:yes gene_type:complete